MGSVFDCRYIRPLDMDRPSPLCKGKIQQGPCKTVYVSCTSTIKHISAVRGMRSSKVTESNSVGQEY